MKNKKYYAVRKGKKPGIYYSWKECEEQIKGFSGQEYKSFDNEEEAKNYLNFNEVNVEINKEVFELIAYTDGSFDSTSKDVFKAGGVIFRENKVIKQISYKYQEKRWSSSNNIAGEIAAVMEVILWAIKNNYKSILIYVDYEGIINWANNEWTAKENISKDFKAFLDNYKEDIIVKFKKVKSHSNNPFNDLADKLAKQGNKYKNASDLIKKMYNYVNPFEIEKYIEIALVEEFRTLQKVQEIDQKLTKEFILKDIITYDEFKFLISKTGLFTWYEEESKNSKKQAFKFKEYIDINFSQEIKRKNKVISIKTNNIKFHDLVNFFKIYNSKIIENKQIVLNDVSDNKLTINFFKNSLVIQGSLTFFLIEVVFLLINNLNDILSNEDIVAIIENIINEFDYDEKESDNYTISLLENIPDSLKELIKQTAKLILFAKNFDKSFEDYSFVLLTTFKALETILNGFIMKSSKNKPLDYTKDGKINFNIFNIDKITGEKIITDKTISIEDSILIIEGHDLYSNYRNQYLHGNILPDNIKKIDSVEEAEKIFNKILLWITKINDMI